MLPYLEEFRRVFNPFMEQQFLTTSPQTLYEPIRYLMNLGGKRLRPYALWLTAYSYDSSKDKLAVPAAYALELFHSFTLVHDDIMDEAPLRRGQPTVHARFDTNTALLSGDAMMVHCMEYLLNHYPDPIALALSRELAKTAVGVCQGQQLDMDFEKEKHVSISAYLKMIEDKTAILLGSALRMGAMVAGADLQDQNSLYQYGKQTGLAFQIQDDYLDAFGGTAFGKQAGGDILQHKKTFLYLKGWELCPPSIREQYYTLYHQPVSPGKEEQDKVNAVKEWWDEWGVLEITRKYLLELEESARASLFKTKLTETGIHQLLELGNALVWRKT